MSIEIKNVKRTIRSGFMLNRLQILKGINFTIPKGKTIGILGPNGAGKTSLIHLVVGIKSPTEGEVTIDGNVATSSKAKRLIGYLPERPYFYDHLTGAQLLFYLGRMHGFGTDYLEDRIQTVLKTVRMEKAANLELRKFSKGMLQRIGIAQAILHEPKYIVLDEPMSGLDPVGRKEIKKLVRGLADQDTTILFSSHLVGDIEDLCEEVMVIKKGELIESGEIKPMLERGSKRSYVEVQLKDKAKVDLIGAYSPQQVSDDRYQFEFDSGKPLQDFLSFAVKNEIDVNSIEKGKSSLEDYFD